MCQSNWSLFDSACHVLSRNFAKKPQAFHSVNIQEICPKTSKTFKWKDGCWITFGVPLHISCWNTHLFPFFMAELNTFNGRSASLTVEAKSIMTALIPAHISTHQRASSTCGMLGVKERNLRYLKELVCRQRLVDAGRIRQAEEKERCQRDLYEKSK